MPSPPLRDPWLVAAWPGMGAVALLSAEYLVKHLGADPAQDLTFDAFFDVRNVRVSGGLMGPASFPRHALFRWRNPSRSGRDLVVLMAEAQPEARAASFCEALLDRVAAEGVVRVVTFAALALPTNPGAASRTQVATTSKPVLDELLASGATPLADGEVGGLNGLFPAIAAARGIDGACLLGEIPFFASSMPNPRGASTVLKVFSRWAGIPLDTAPIETKAEEVDRQLTELFDRLRHAAESRDASERTDEGTLVPTPEQEEEQGLSARDRERIESLFEATAADRRHALALKAELDRLGVYREYEDRFLDLFRRAD